MTFLFPLLACTAEPTGKVGPQADTGVEQTTDDADSDGYRSGVDCNDADASIHPGGTEIWYDGVDQDCDGADDDQDGDGFGQAVDCDDTDPTVSPDAGEVPDDGIDQDCDGYDSTSTSSDADGDGYGASVDCDDTNASIHPGADDPEGDGADQDCDGLDGAASADADGDGWAAEAFGGPDCDDTNPAINTDAAEAVGDDVDSDCDGADYGIEGLVAGDLVITEIMYDPDAVSDADGEWFELVNVSGHTINLLGLVVADDSAFDPADIFTVESNLLAEDGVRLVLGVSDATDTNGGITVDYDYAGGGVTFNNGGDDLYVGVLDGARATTIDSVAYDELAGWPSANGYSIELNDAHVDSSDNDSAGNWCRATAAAGSTSDRGSPGAISSGC